MAFEAVDATGSSMHCSMPSVWVWVFVGLKSGSNSHTTVGLVPWLDFDVRRDGEAEPTLAPTAGGLGTTSPSTCSPNASGTTRATASSTGVLWGG